MLCTVYIIPRNIDASIEWCLTLFHDIDEVFYNGNTAANRAGVSLPHIAVIIDYWNVADTSMIRSTLVSITPHPEPASSISHRR